ncbi:MAG TPA: endolytic transglycosylase MltG [Candidatus Paceibacterota bacterium]|nr:endolytic transglycosylase MltG [Candidatus Paceibacterota bacterium]
MKLNFKIKIGLAVFGVFMAYFFFFAPPFKFPSGKIIAVVEGMPLRQISKVMKEERIIRSRFLFEMFVIMLGGEKGVLASNYLFEKPINSFHVAWRLIRWQHNLAPIKVVFPEGMTTREMAAVLSAKIQDFDEKKFLAIAEPKEGFLFPDTYLFFLDAAPDVIVGQLAANFQNKIKQVEEKIAESSHTLNEIITMASIIEKESLNGDERQIVSGILWKRISLGMPLQVDATFLYINGKASAELTKDDLNIDSPYNTYRNKGLPPGPINNPGLDAIVAALYPKDSPYLYYLHDKKGKVHYAKTFNEHVANKRKYL